MNTFQISFPLVQSFGEGNGTPLQYFCLENPMDGGAWWAAVHGVTRVWQTERLHFHFSLSCIGEGNGNPLQCSCLENPRDGGAWWAAVCRVTQSRTRLKWLSSSSSIPRIPQPTWAPLPMGLKMFFMFLAEFSWYCLLSQIEIIVIHLHSALVSPTSHCANSSINVSLAFGKPQIFFACLHVVLHKHFGLLHVTVILIRVFLYINDLCL